MPISQKTYIPTLRGTAAYRFLKMAEANFRNRGSVDFSKEYAEAQQILKKKPRT